MRKEPFTEDEAIELLQANTPADAFIELTEGVDRGSRLFL